MNNIVEVDCRLVTLSGVILSSSLTLHNPHELLAVMFQLESKPDFLQIEPMRGMIMQGDRKRIKLRCKNEARPLLQQLQKQENRLVIRGSYFCEYNKKIMDKNKLKGWSKISREITEFSIPIYFNFTEEIEKIKEEAQRSGSLRNSRKMNSFQKFRDSSVKRIKNEKLNEDLDFIFRNEEFKKAYESKYSYGGSKSPKENHYEKDEKAKTSPQLFNQFAASPRSEDAAKTGKQLVSRIIQEGKPRIQQSSPFQASSQIKQHIKQPNPQTQNPRSNRAFELIVLAIIAALSLAFGQSFGSIVKH